VGYRPPKSEKHKSRLSGGKIIVKVVGKKILRAVGKKIVVGPRLVCKTKKLEKRAERT